MKIQISDMKLPERDVSNILSILEANEMPARVPQNEYRGSFNCWGFTAYYHEWEKEALWLEGRVMEDHLEAHTTPIRKEDVRAGDIAVFRRDMYLTHTAILLPSGDVVCHKPGGLALCIDTIEAAAKSYGEVSYVRAKKKVKKEFDKSQECVSVGA
jgi:hypothetical protein